MIITDLPVEMILPIIYKTNYIDVIQLYMVCTRFKSIIECNAYDIYLSFEKNSSELYWYPCYQTSDWYEAFNYQIFLNIYIDSIKNKKKSLIMLKYIYAYIVGDSDVDYIREALLGETIHCYLMQLYPNKIKAINKESEAILHEDSPFLKKTIEKYVPHDLLNSIDITGIKIPGLRKYPFNFEHPKIYIYDNKTKSTIKYLIKLNNNDTKLFDIY